LKLPVNASPSNFIDSLKIILYNKKKLWSDNMSLKDKYQPVVDLINELNSSETRIWVDRGTLFIRARISDFNSKELIMKKVQQVNLQKGHDIDIKLFISEN
jgi:hypothetical protein